MLMNSYIEFFYGMNNIVVNKENDNYIFYHNGDKYFFCKLKRSESELYEISKLIFENPKIDSIEKNIYNKLITNIYNQQYILVKKSSINIQNKVDGVFFLLGNRVITNNAVLDKSNWIDLWSKKIDNIEYQINYIENKYPIIKKSINYYIGLSEIALIYIRRNIGNKTFYLSKVISHLRMTDNNIYNPQNIIIDYESRDIAEYLKYIFLKKKRNYLDVVDFIFRNRNFDELTLILIYGRMFFPTFYFDIYDNVLSNMSNEDELYEIISRNYEYEDYINYIYDCICKQKKIPKISII